MENDDKKQIHENLLKLLGKANGTLVFLCMVSPLPYILCRKEEERVKIGAAVLAHCLGWIHASGSYSKAGLSFCHIFELYAFSLRWGQMPVLLAMRHKSVIVEVASQAMGEGRKPLLGVLYDELSRCVLAVVVSFRCLVDTYVVGKIGKKRLPE